MRAVDTNVLVRLLVCDDSGQLAAAEALMRAAGHLWISHVVLCETVWVLESVYARRRDQIGNAVRTLLDHSAIVLEDTAVVQAALATFDERRPLQFSDCLVLEIARKAGFLPLGTFDSRLGALEGAQRLGARPARG
jgi:predicted nucleic-acid-binding protein